MRRAEFDSKLQARGECLLWTGCANHDGYGRYRYAGKQGMAHKYAWERLHGPVPDGMVVMHKCDIPACCNTDHLELGTQGQNIADKVKKDRQAKGTRNAAAILTESIVTEARASYSFRKMTYQMLADKYGVSKDAMQKAIRGILWRHV